jgi:Uma2 family endonuclease
MSTTKLMTSEELLAMGEDFHYELFRGELRPLMTTKPKHGRVAGHFVARLSVYGEFGETGVVYTAEVGFTLEREPDTVFAPDIAYFRSDRAPTGAEAERFTEIPPDVAIEVLSPSNTRPEMLERSDIFLAAGVRLVLIADPDRQIIEARDKDGARVFRMGDQLAGLDALPGFDVPVAAFFR